MSLVKGRISVDVQFTDSTTASGVQSLKTIALQEATEYTTGKVAILTGTAGTAAVSVGQIGTIPSTYRNASGDLVTFAVVRRIAFAWSGSSQRTLTDNEYDSFKVHSSGSTAALTSFTPADNISPLISSGTGTGTYTIVVYGT